MRPTLWRSIAAVSSLLAAGLALDAARRPRYGGELRVEMEAAYGDPAALPEPFAGQVFESLVRLDDHGEFRPWLAASWSHDIARKRWTLVPRAGVVTHNGAAWAPGPMVFPDDAPIENILRDLVGAAPASTGPFRVARWEPGRSARLEAHATHWRGRPYLDAVELRMGRPLREQVLDLELGKADAVETPVTEIRRLRQRGTIVSVSPPIETLALRFESERASAAVREAVALAIDRTAIHGVLLQRQGEASAALLPRWLSGYAFLFSADRNVARAKQLAASAPPLAYGYDPQDSVSRAVAERIAVNAAEAGIVIRPAGNAAPDVRVIRLPVESRDARLALTGIAIRLRVPLAKDAANPYEIERALLEGFRVIPIAHLPRAWALSPRVRNWGPLEDAWLEPAEPKP
jgi:peptide/nickel transport system substrate-binding protein